MTFHSLQSVHQENNMAVITIYKCDKCGAEQPTNVQMWKIGVVCQPLDSNTKFTPNWLYASQSDYNHQIWCRKCIDAFMILAAPKASKPTDPPPPAPLSLEERLMAIFTEVVEGAVEDRISNLRR
jgi:hypothetical protein